MTVSRLGAANEGGDKLELFYKIFTGEVMVAFKSATKFIDKHRVRTISHGKSAGFNAIGGTTAAYHTPGVMLTGGSIKHAERTISIDGLLLAQQFIADIDEAMNHYDVRGPYADEMGYALALEFDTNVSNEIVLAARAAATITGGNGGSIVADADVGSADPATQVNAFIKALFSMRLNFVTKNVPKPWFCALGPALYGNIVQTVQTNGFSAIHKDYGTEGSFASGEVYRIGGFELIESNTVPATDMAARTFHAVNANTTKAICWNPQAVGTVKLMDLSMQSEYSILHQGTIMVARYAMGHGILRPECAGEIRTGNPT